MTIPRHFRIGTAFRTRTFGLLGALALASAASLTAPSPAAATPITYVLNASATWTDSNHPSIVYGTDTFAGTFVWDPAAANISFTPYTDVHITVSGPFAPGVYTNASLSSPGSNIVLTPEAGPPPVIDIPFDFVLGSTPGGGSGISLFGIGCGRCGLPSTATDENSTSGFVRSIPEPASLALLGSALGLFLVALRLKRRRNRA